MFQNQKHSFRIGPTSTESGPLPLNRAQFPYLEKKEKSKKDWTSYDAYPDFTWQAYVQEKEVWFRTRFSLPLRTYKPRIDQVNTTGVRILSFGQKESYEREKEPTPFSLLVLLADSTVLSIWLWLMAAFLLAAAAAGAVLVTGNSFTSLTQPARIAGRGLAVTCCKAQQAIRPTHCMWSPCC